MHRSRKLGVLFAAALLALSLAAPAAAKKGGNDGPPSGTGLDVTVEPSSGLMWANSVGDQILFDITVTNTSGGDLEEVAATFTKIVDGVKILLEAWPVTSKDAVVLAKNDSWTAQYPYTVRSTDFVGTTLVEQNSVTAGTVTATAGEVTDSAYAVMTAYPVPTCGQVEPEAPFRFGPNGDYSVCSFSGTGNWTLTTTLDSNRPPRGKRDNPSATVRDGVPGNWCTTGVSVVDENTVIDYQFLAPTCSVGGAGGDPIPVRNPDTFYLATWRGNMVFAEPTS